MNSIKPALPLAVGELQMSLLTHYVFYFSGSRGHRKMQRPPSIGYSVAVKDAKDAVVAAN
jgi:hypothetical protein